MTVASAVSATWSSGKPHAALSRFVHETQPKRRLLALGGRLQVQTSRLIHAINSVGVLLLQSAAVIPPHPVKVRGRNVQRSVIRIDHALVSLPFSKMKGTQIHFN